MITLHTKDGSRIGNAIIIGGGTKMYSSGDIVNLFTIETDFGNRLNLTWSEIEEMFTIGQVYCYKAWSNDRSNLRESEPEPLANRSDWIYELTPEKLGHE